MFKADVIKELMVQRSKLIECFKPDVEHTTTNIGGYNHTDLSGLSNQIEVIDNRVDMLLGITIDEESAKN